MCPPARLGRFRPSRCRRFRRLQLVEVVVQVGEAAAQQLQVGQELVLVGGSGRSSSSRLGAAGAARGRRYRGREREE